MLNAAIAPALSHHRAAYRFALLLALVAGLAACALPDPDSLEAVTAPPAAAPAKVGSSCLRTSDCGEARLCVAQVCQHAASSASGEILLAAGRAQGKVGDTLNALRSFTEARLAYEKMDAPVPPALYCDAAMAALLAGAASEDVAMKEQGAKDAHLCFRHTLPGDAIRATVGAALAKLRFDGLDLALFDEETPAERYFTKPPSRPTPDAIDIALELSARELPGYEALGEQLRSEDAQRVIANCFIADWELKHGRQAQANVVLIFESRLKDMGYYDAYEPTLEIKGEGEAAQGFEPCVAEALATLLGTGPKVGRVTSWKEPLQIAARLR